MLQILALLALCCGSALAMGKPENVLVVQNSNSPVSMSIASYYVAARGIPAANLATLSTADSSLSTTNERMTYADYLSQIETPVRDHLASHNIQDTIQYIVLTKGIPHRLTAEVTGGISGGQSVDSMLATIDLVDPIRVGFVNKDEVLLGSPYISRYWRSTQPFSHTVYGGYLVTRLDGYTEADAKALVDRALAPCSAPLYVHLDARSTPAPDIVAEQPKSILLPDGTLDEDYQLTYADYDGDIVRSSQVLADRPFLSIALDQTGTHLTSTSPVTCYVSWGSNAGTGYETAYHSITFAPRAIAETAVSSSGRTFLTTTGGQSLIADLIAQGAAGAKGYATEPYLDSIASPTVVFLEYTSGRNLAESFYAASRFIGWKDVVLGDPLCTLDLTNGSAAAAKAMGSQSLATVSGMVSAVFASCIYVQDSSLGGIRVYLAAAQPDLVEGTQVTVRGLLSTIDHERVITNARVAF